MFIEVGGLIGLVGGTEVRSAFPGTLEGVLVLAGERVTRGQPVAWLRAPVRNEQGTARARADEELVQVEALVRDGRTIQDERTA